MALAADIRRRAAEVSLLALDVDGVLTDGRLWYGPDGEALKPFHVRDGLGLKLVQRAGVEVTVVTAKRSGPLLRRLRDLGLHRARTGREDKGRALVELTEELELDPSRVAYVGDDLPDLLMFERVGLPIAVADAHPRVREAAAWVTELPGGAGAVREVCDALLEARGVLDETVAAYLDEHR